MTGRKRYGCAGEKTWGASSVPGREFLAGLSSNMLSRMMCDALHEADLVKVSSS